MKRGIAAGVVFLLALWSSHGIAAPNAAYISEFFNFWGFAGVNANRAAMTTAFGPEAVGWDDLRISGGPGPFLPGSGYTFIFLEGGDSNANELNAYLNANRAAIEAFVFNGGTLLLNSAPNEGGNINFGFGGVTLTYPRFSSTATAADPSHPVFAEPHGATGTSFSGNFFGHAVVSGPGLAPIINGAGGQAVLAEMNWGQGLVLFGGMTTSNFHSPQPAAQNLRANILAYTASGGGAPDVDTDGDGLPDFWENLYGTDPNDPNDPVLTEDVDGDGLDWLAEFQQDTNPLVADTDGDNVNDGEEVRLGTNPRLREPVTILMAGQAADIGSVFFQFGVTALDPQTTGFRVFYGASSGTDFGDYDAFFDIPLSARDGLIYQEWGLQGVPFVYIRIAPIREVNPVFIGPLSNEVFTYFAGEPRKDSSGAQITFPGPNPNSGGAGQLDDSDDSDDLWGFCFVGSLGGAHGATGLVAGGLGLVAAALGGAWVRSRRKSRR